MYNAQGVPLSVLTYFDTLTALKEVKVYHLSCIYNNLVLVLNSEEAMTLSTEKQKYSVLSFILLGYRKSRSKQ